MVRLAISFLVLSAAARGSDEGRDIRLPAGETHLRQVASYVEAVPDADYRHASSAAYEAFRDLKFGVRVHWGLYSIWGFKKESWPFLMLDDPKREEYQRLSASWNPSGFDAEAWMRLFEGAGARFFTFTTKHHDGFSLFDTRTRVRRRVNWSGPDGRALEDCDLAYSIMETPFHRDVVGELTAAAHAHGLKIDLYFSLPDWYDADFRPYNFHPVQIPDAAAWAPNEVGKLRPKFGSQAPFLAPDPTPAEINRMMGRLHDQLVELLTHYGRIDMIGLDQWLGPKVWPQLKATVKELRRIQPDVMLRARGIGNYGDYFTPERYVPTGKENTGMPWFVIYPLGQGFSYDSDADDYKGARWIVDTLADTIAKGGNLEIGVGPDGQGRFHPAAIQQMLEAGAWIRAHGKAIYGTRARPGALWREGRNVRFTRSKDGRTVYAFLLQRPGRELSLSTVGMGATTRVSILGGRQLAARAAGSGMTIDLGGEQPPAPELATVVEIDEPE
jgi:alpha-L-fucosidase